MRVVFKQEDEWQGEAIGPVVVLMDGEEPFEPRPYQERCECGNYDERRLQATARNKWGVPLCPDCKCELPMPWLTISQAERMAGEHGTWLEVS